MRSFQVDMKQDQQVIATLSAVSAIACLCFFALAVWIGIFTYSAIDMVNQPELLFSREYDGERHRYTPFHIIAFTPLWLAMLAFFAIKTANIIRYGLHHVIYDCDYLIFRDVIPKKIHKNDIRKVEFARYSDRQALGFYQPDTIEIHYAPFGSPGDTRVARMPSVLYQQSSDTIATNLRRVGIDVTPRMVTIQDDL